ncbi:MAG: hypothetical protein IKY34_05615 [Ruminiclostridium sp.]|nr:hypothetical protein [Ruminiclostridium sp.]
MELLRTWVLGVTAASLVFAVAEAIMPRGTVKKVGKLTGGLILVLVLLQPLSGLDYQDLYDQVMSLPAVSLTQQTLEEQTNRALETGIEEELAAYIAEKGAELGIPCTVWVNCVPDVEGVPIPMGVEVTGPVTQAQKEALQALIAQDLGVGPEGQQYISEEAA